MRLRQKKKAKVGTKASVKIAPMPISWFQAAVMFPVTNTPECESKKPAAIRDQHPQTQWMPI